MSYRRPIFILEGIIPLSCHPRQWSMKFITTKLMTGSVAVTTSDHVIPSSHPRTWLLSATRGVRTHCANYKDKQFPSPCHTRPRHQPAQRLSLFKQLSLPTINQLPGTKYRFDGAIKSPTFDKTNSWSQ